MILSCQNLSISFADTPILEKVSFQIEDCEKAALVGKNGAGKTTLFRIIAGRIQPDQGAVAFAKDKTFGYLAQDDAVDTQNTIYEELLSVKGHLVDLEKRIRAYEQAMPHSKGEALKELMSRYAELTHTFEAGGGYAYQSEVTGVLRGLGFSQEDFGRRVFTLSGGQKTRVALGKLLLAKPDLILLDEPTNHLDLNAVAWLETFLSSYRGAVLVVSHDRYFLDKVASKIIELERGKATVFSGGYSDYAAKKERLRAAAISAYLNQQRQIRHQEEVIERLRSFNREKSVRRAQSREKMLERMETLEKPQENAPQMRLTLTPRLLSGKDVLTVSHLRKAFGENRLFEDLSFTLRRGEHAALIGDNGAGKTTLLKIISGLLCPDGGVCALGSNVEIGYYDQEHQVLCGEKTLFEELSDACPALTNTQIRNVLAAFLFTGDDVLKQINDLSGGERGRVSLAKLMLGNANFLILDEPTNHLDIASREILEDALNSYEGTLLYVSHDRYFIRRTASRILHLTDGRLFSFPGGYEDYLEKLKAQAASFDGLKETGNTGKKAASLNAPSESKLDWQAKKEEQARLRKKENDLKKCEEKIAALEERLRELDNQLADPSIGAQSEKLSLIALAREQALQELNGLYETWEHLAQ